MRGLLIWVVLAGCGSATGLADHDAAASDAGVPHCDRTTEAERCCPTQELIDESECPPGTRFIRDDRIDQIGTQCSGFERDLLVVTDRATGGVKNGHDWTTRGEASDLLVNYTCHPATGYRATTIREQPPGTKCIEPCLSESGEATTCAEILADIPPCQD